MDTQTDHDTRSVCRNSPHLMQWMRCGLAAPVGYRHIRVRLSSQTVMIVNHGFTGTLGTSPPEFGVRREALMQIVPQILSCFNISSMHRIACIKSIIIQQKLTNPVTLTENFLLPTSTPSTSTISPLQAEIEIQHTQKCRSECTKTPFRMKNSIFLRRSLANSPDPSPGGERYPAPQYFSPPLTITNLYLRRPEFQPVLRPALQTACVDDSGRYG